MTEVEVKKVDPQGRVSLPSEWRKTFLDRVSEVVIIMMGHRLEILPRNADISKYVNAVNVDIKNFGDYHKLKEELMSH